MFLLSVPQHTERGVDAICIILRSELGAKYIHGQILCSVVFKNCRSFLENCPEELVKST